MNAGKAFSTFMLEMESVIFWFSKLVWQAIAPDVLLLYLVFAAWVCLSRGFVRAAKRIVGAIAVLLLLVTLFPVDEWILSPLENVFPPHPELPRAVDGIIVLAGPEDMRGAVRYSAFQSLARQYPDAKLVSTNKGGNMLTDHYSESLVKDWSAQAGFDVSRIMFEINARNTFENALLSKALVHPSPRENWILVTSAFHMPRSMGVFCKAGWAVIPYPVEHLAKPGEAFRLDPDLALHNINLSLGVREWVGLLGYYVAGKTNTLLPRHCD